MNEPSTQFDPSPRIQRFSRLAAWFVGGAALGLLLVAIAVRIMSNETRMPPLTAADWQQARDRWRAAPEKNYDLEVVVTGRQAAKYSVQVRDGEVVNASRDGATLPQLRTWSTWSVEGMFDTIARDLESVERHEQGRAEPGTPRLQLRAVFDPGLGYPRQYLRTEMVRFGANPEVSWQVVRFERFPLRP